MENATLTHDLGELVAPETDCDPGDCEHAQERSADRETLLRELLRKQRLTLVKQRHAMLEQSREIARLTQQIKDLGHKPVTADGMQKED